MWWKCNAGNSFSQFAFRVFPFSGPAYADDFGQLQQIIDMPVDLLLCGWPQMAGQSCPQAARAPGAADVGVSPGMEMEFAQGSYPQILIMWKKDDKDVDPGLRDDLLGQVHDVQSRYGINLSMWAARHCDIAFNDIPCLAEGRLYTQ